MNAEELEMQLRRRWADRKNYTTKMFVPENVGGFSESAHSWPPLWLSPTLQDLHFS